MAIQDKLLGKLKQASEALTNVQRNAKQLTTEITSLQTRISKINTLLDNTSTGRNKPGPKPKAVKAAGKTRGKPGPKPKATTKAKTKGNNSRATQGRRAVAQGLRPPIKKAMIEVCGKKTMNASEMYEALNAKGWLPDSNDPRAYISYLFSSLKDSFERVEGKVRGYYRVRDSVTAGDTKKSTKKTEPTTETTSAAPDATNSSDVDEVLKEAGVIPASPAN